MTTSALKQAMRAEAQVLNEFAAGQKRLQELIGKRQWTRVETEIEELKCLSSRAEALEDGRHAAYRALKTELGMGEAADPAAGGGGAPSFEEVVTRLPAGERDELFALYRQLKLEVIRVKGNAGLLGYYLRSLSGTLQKVLEELFPHRKGRLYSRSGKTREAGDDSLVVYRHV
ncbi:MAG: hypothetical protein JW820_04525 [Spirochaetales bacterium]|nr:hypothetical protein [Spirochaetales bacterium]